MNLNYLLKGSILTALFLTVTSCSNEPEIPENDPGFSEYISAHTSGVISAYSTIEFHLLSDINPGVEPGTVEEADIIEFSPEIPGVLTWEDASTLVYTPDEPLESGESFEGLFHLGELMEVPSKFQTYKFLVQVIEQDFIILDYKINPLADRELKWNKLEGEIRSADISSIDELLREIRFTEISEDQLTWETGENEQRFAFTIDSIERKDEGYTLDAIRGDEVLGTFRIPGLNDFSVLTVNAVQSPVQKVTISFSDPILETQNTSGLFLLNNNGVENVEIDGSVVTLYPSSHLNGTISLTVAQGLKNSLGYRFTRDYQTTVVFTATKPEVKFVEDGNIVPLSGTVSIPFQAVGLKAVDVQIYKVFTSNVHQFLQVNSMNGDRELRRVARPFHQQRIDLTGEGVNYNSWTTFAIDLDEMIERDPGAIYRVELSFRKSYSFYPCSEEENEALENSVDFERTEDWDSPNRNYYYYDDYYYEYYDYRERDNPCHISYYNRSRSVQKNIFATDLGLLVKGNDGKYTSYVTSLATTQPMSGVDVVYYNFQGQEIARAKTGSEGSASIELNGVPFRVEAQKGKQRAYLTLENANSLSLSSFDVSGVDVSDGISAFMYAERGVWRPGDTVYLNAIINDEDNPLPQTHPISMTIRDPDGKLIHRTSVSRGTQQIFDFHFSTDPEAVTGTYRAQLDIGGKRFYKSLPIEMVLPNRLDITVKPRDTRLSKDNPYVDIHSEWLTGARAGDANFTMEGQIVGDYRPFEEYEEYDFHDETRSIPRLGNTIIAESKLNSGGDQSVRVELGSLSNASGPLKLNISSKVFEPGGRFSIDNAQMSLAPYTHFVGHELPDANNYGYYETDKSHLISLVTVDMDGNPVDRNVVVSVYKVDWSWWWSARNGNPTYLSSSSSTLVTSQNITTSNGKGIYELSIPDDRWGRMLVVVEDKFSGHRSSSLMYVDWPWGRDRSGRAGGESVSTLNVTTDKANYNVGDQVVVSVPSSAGGKLILSVETGREQMEDYVVDTEDGTTKVTFKATSDMAPNVYASAVIVQPHAQTANDLPIRLYGVVPVMVEDPNTRLIPVLQTPEKTRPESTFEVKVSERNGRDMEYTLAVVDEGLLGLTNFSTPDPWASFYAKRALGVRTWDVYDLVMSSFSGRIARMLSVGGDAALNPVNEERAERFKAVVRHLGPFKLESGRTATHQITVPNYLGNLRVMVVAADSDESYGSVAKNVRVIQPMMAQLTLPRVLGPGETVSIPVTVFAMEDNIREVNVQLTTSANIRLSTSSQRVRFTETGQKTIYFEAVVDESLGLGNVSMRATSGNERSTEDIEISIRSPLHRQTQEESYVLTGNQTATYNPTPFGVETSNSMTIEISSVPPVNLEERLQYLVGYPHGCVEQTTSKGMVQLFLPKWVEMTADQKADADANVRAAISKLRSMQMADGGFRYWPSSSYASPWGSTYAGHFIIAAEAQGIPIPAGMKSAYLRFAKRGARTWSQSGYYAYDNDLNQAYRLYVLALAGEPELGAMNRLRNRSSLSTTAAHRLALAFSLVNEDDAAQELMRFAQPAQVTNEYYYYTYGSSVRDMAMEMESYHAMGNITESMRLAQSVAEELSSNRYHSTQTIAFSLYALSQVYENASEGVNANVIINGNTHQINTDMSVATVPLTNFDARARVQIENLSGDELYVRILKSGVPHYGEEMPYQDGVEMNVQYIDHRTGNSLNVSSLNVGDPIRVVVNIKRLSNSRDYNDLALSQIFPSGWEITNSRLMSVSETGGTGLDHMDIRDDRVLSYFSMQRMGRGDISITVDLTATYPGRWYLPPTTLEAMYNDKVKASTSGQWVEVVNE